MPLGSQTILIVGAGPTGLTAAVELARHGVAARIISSIAIPPPPRFISSQLDGYTADRRPVGRRWIRLSERILAAAQMSNPSGITLRNLAIRIVGNLPSLQRPMLMRVAGLKA